MAKISTLTKYTLVFSGAERLELLVCLRYKYKHVKGTEDGRLASLIRTIQEVNNG